MVLHGLRGGWTLVTGSILGKILSERFSICLVKLTRCQSPGPASTQTVRSFTTPGDFSRLDQKPGRNAAQKKRKTSQIPSSPVKLPQESSSEDLFTKAALKISVSAAKKDKSASQNRRDGNNAADLENSYDGSSKEYPKVASGYKTFRYDAVFYCKYHNAVLPGLDIAYETYGELYEDKSNAILLSGGMSDSVHGRSYSGDTKPGWWEKFIGPGCAVDTDKYFVICSNYLGGCYGSSGPSSNNPETGKPYGTTFPLVSVTDIVNAQFLLLDHLGIDQLYATIGLSFVRYLQRKCIMSDPHWNNGHYYGRSFPHAGMKLARELGYTTYRTAQEWNERFSRKRINPCEEPELGPTFLVESYLAHQGEKFCTIYDPNSYLYLSKAMDLFDVGEDYRTMEEALTRIKCPVMIIGATTDKRIPVYQQRELAAACRSAGNSRVTFYELDSIYGHDAYLLDIIGVGSAVKRYLET